MELHNQRAEVFLQMLWERSYGGAEVAAVPAGRSSSSVDALAPAGVAEASEWFQTELRRGGRSVPVALFLVGGPGGGKSAAATKIVGGYELLDRVSPLAERKYTYKTSRGKLVVVNDATIPGDRDDCSLVAEINDAISDRSDLLVCANRGVLVDELSKVHSQTTSPGKALLSWINGGRAPSSEVNVAQEPEALRVDAQEMPERGFVRGGRLREGGEALVSAQVVFLDECSLFENRPKVEVSADGPRPQPYRIGSFQSETDRSQSCAQSLMEQIWSRVPEEETGWHEELSDNPVWENVRNLGSAVVRRGLFDVLRASEIINGRRLSYRDLWAVIARSVAGRLPARMDVRNVDEWAQGRLRVAESRVSKVEDRWSAAKDLAETRFFMSLFAGGADEGRGLVADPLDDQLAAADPASDAPPGWLGKGAGWSTPVIDAFSVVGTETSPLSWLKSQNNAALAQAIGPVEELVDKVFVAVCHEQNDKARREATAWYGRFLLRLYAVVNGVSALSSEVQWWVDAWTAASRGGRLTRILEDGLQTLLNPTSEKDSTPSTYVRTFSSRAEPVLGRVDTPTLATRLTRVGFGARVDGERIWVSVEDRDKSVGELQLDIGLIRQISTVAGDHFGLTELTPSIEPRLERTRSARLKTNTGAGHDLTVLTGASPLNLIVSGRS